MYTEGVKEFAARTQSNLKALEDLRNSDSGVEVYEVTQLINSLLGLIVFPQQEYVDEIPETSISELRKFGWPLPKLVDREQYTQVENLKQLVRYLRNAVTHYNIEFMPDKNGKIIGLIMWNCLEGGRVDWKAYISEDDLRKFCDKFADWLQKQ